jgi:hypothetical protein
MADRSLEGRQSMTDDYVRVGNERTPFFKYVIDTPVVMRMPRRPFCCTTRPLLLTCAAPEPMEFLPIPRGWWADAIGGRKGIRGHPVASSAWRRKHLRWAARHDQRAGTVAVVLE